jgi:hypothetical protein
MTEDFEAQLKWFTKRLLQIRIGEVKGFSLPIPFNLSYISQCEAVQFNTRISPKVQLEELIEEIRGFYVKYSNNSVNRDDIRLEYSNNDPSVKIFGIDSDLLKYFIIKRLKSNTSLFETKADNALFYVGLDTDVVLSSAEQSIFAKLRELKEGDEILSYNDIFDIVAQHEGQLRESFIRRNDTSEKKDTVARSTISYLLGRIMESELLARMEQDKIIKNERGQGYKLML